ncbi:peptidyl-prolyl cis-trans isomerase [Psychrosphaera saromensis]|uniref:peptidylprolyl isomerase n=1 Tax=Psychrosphaera saromensis TaxID=716813 RepID=UPI000CF4127D|nr:peptidylprolyl isomerase [Psychrosphaera saromensis]GHB66910.1 peptidyl-prolyl cis-trans isomerase [Psychrosphaera saromensis]GLQ14996.1 peptidyl-prolyl cis-trans isomerase [Psychrosphaera saromensis]
MKRLLLTLMLSLFTFDGQAAVQPTGQYIQPNNLFPKVLFVTSIGNITVELDRMKAPITVDNFLSYVDAKRYEDTIFHRLEHNFVLQGGGYTSKMESVEEFPQIVNESGNGVKNDQFSLSMARQYTPHSATSQFFFNLADNDSLNPGRNWGYTVFGSIIQGEDVLEKLEGIETDISPELGWPSFPTKKIVIIKVQILAE